MKRITRSLPALALTIALASPLAHAASEYDADVKADVNAVAKDDAALAKQQQTLEENRASKEYNKQTGDVAGQAVDSVKIGANHVGIAEKKAEKSADKRILKHHKVKRHESIKAGANADTNGSVETNTSVETNSSAQ